MSKQDLAILFSGASDSLALYALAVAGRHPDIPIPRAIHLLGMDNGISRFNDFPFERFKIAEKILKAQAPPNDPVPEACFVALDMRRIFQGLWLDHYEALMPRYNGKNLVCAACRLGMHARAVVYCVERLVPTVIAADAGICKCTPQPIDIFLAKIKEFAAGFGIKTRFPGQEDLHEAQVVKHLLEDHGLPSDSGGERQCMFSQSGSSVSAKEVGAYLDDMIPRLARYVESRLEGRIRDAALCFGTPV